MANSQYTQFEIPGVVTIEPAQGGLPRITIDIADAHGEIYLHGAHVTQYTPPRGRPLLFMSHASQFAPGKPIRGGVPIIFPWFGPHPTDPKLPAHGFARTSDWELSSIRRDADRVTVELALKSSEATRQLWPHDFELRFRVIIGPKLVMSLIVRNSGSAPFTYEEALHTYLAVSDVRQLSIQGLGGRDYLDKMKNAQRLRQDDNPIRIVAETDRVYLGTTDTITVEESTGRKIIVAKTGSNATVVWNPWIAKAKAMADFGDDEWPTMLCIETANAAEHAVVLQPAEEHIMQAIISEE